MSHIMLLEKGYVDERGKILPIEHDLANVQVIWSNKGAVRANHYHITDTHACYLISGELDYYWRAHGESSIHKEKIVAGQKFTTGPNIDHEMVFTEESIMVVISEHKRDASSYDKDIVKIDPLHLKYEHV
ncbi:MAG: hypothetical protein EBU90_15670 [Proteobacteria bacterium]|nr:hypothetical protein [Pseudomonadota bacterium]NBP14477.1 hypothetical protein [bacterium]